MIVCVRVWVDVSEWPRVPERFGVAPGGARRGLMVARSARCADCTAVLDQGSRRRTRFAHCVRFAQTVATSQSTKRAARADPCPAILVAPQIAPDGHRLARRFFSCVATHQCTSKGVPGQATARLRSAEQPARESGRRIAPTAEVKRRGLSGHDFAAPHSECDALLLPAPCDLRPPARTREFGVTLHAACATAPRAGFFDTSNSRTNSSTATRANSGV